jgi:hypothetical protein
LVCKLAVRKFDKLRNEVVPPRRVGWKVNTLGNDGFGVDAKARGLRSAIGINWHNKLCELLILAIQIRNKRVAVGGALDEDSNRAIPVVEAANFAAQFGIIALFTK